MKIFITRLLPDRCVKQLTDAGYSVEMWKSDEPVDYDHMIKSSEDIDGLLCTLSDKVDEHFINSAKKLKVISTVSVGYDHIDLPTAKKRHIKVGNTSGDSSASVAEMAVGLLLTVSRRITEGVSAVKDGSWGAWKPFWLCGHELNNSTVGIVGLGNIGKSVARRLRPFGVKHFYAFDLYFGESGKDMEIDPNLMVTMTDFDNLLKQCDFVVVTCTLNEKTMNLFDKSAYSKMKSNAIFVNISRGPVVNQDALYAALKEGKIAGAGLDVTVPEPLPVNHPLLSLRNCVVLPHLGSATNNTRDAMCDLAVNNLIHGLQGKEMITDIK